MPQPQPLAAPQTGPPPQPDADAILKLVQALLAAKRQNQAPFLTEPELAQRRGITPGTVFQIGDLLNTGNGPPILDEYGRIYPHHYDAAGRFRPVLEWSPTDVR